MRGLAIAAMLAVTRIAVADPVDATEAGQAFQRGRDLARDGRFPEACVEFGHSYELDPALGTAVNLADCVEHLGQLRRAWQLFDLVARAQGSQSRARFARQRADALLPRLATLVVRVREPAAPGLALRIGDQAVPPAAEIRELVEPSDVVITATLPGRPVFRATVHAVAGAMNTIEVPALAAPDAPAETRRRRPYVYLAGGLAAAGAVGLATSVVLGLGARSAYHDALDIDCAPANIAGDAGYARCRARVDRAGERADHATAIAIGGVRRGAARVGPGRAARSRPSARARRRWPVLTVQPGANRGARGLTPPAATGNVESWRSRTTSWTPTSCCTTPARSTRLPTTTSSSRST